MVELIVGTYGVLCWLVFKKFKLVPVTTYTVCTAIFIGAAGMGVLFVALSVFHPVSHDGRLYAPVVQIVPSVRGLVVLRLGTAERKFRPNSSSVTGCSSPWLLRHAT